MTIIQIIGIIIKILPWLLFLISLIVNIIFKKLLEKKKKENFKINKQNELDKEYFRKKLRERSKKYEKNINNANSINDLVNIANDILQDK
jgi:hypothetical protein